MIVSAATAPGLEARGVRPPGAPSRTGGNRPLRVFLCSHDGFGLGHLRRNTLIAAELRAAMPDVQATLVTGTSVDPGWAEAWGMRVLRLPPILKDACGVYRALDTDTPTALGVRERLFRDAVSAQRPDMVVVDRHPYGTSGELRAGLELAAASGAVLVLGLRDVLDEPAVIRAEMAGPAWADVPELFDEVLVYGSPQLVDHEKEYGLPVTPSYVGWVAAAPRRQRRVPHLLTVSAGGGADGAATFRLGLELARRRTDWSATLVGGPYSADLPEVPAELTSRVRLIPAVRGCAELLATAHAVIQMAGYNSTIESLAAGLRPILVPRRRPRREQAIRASRLASWGLADVVDAGADADEIGWLLDQPRELRYDALARAGLGLDGAARTVDRLVGLLVEWSAA